MRPKTLTILGQRWTIQYGPLDGEHGNTDGDKRRIVIDSSDKSAPGRHTLLHEVLHAILHESGQNETLGALEEGVVRAIEHGLAPLLKTLAK